MTKNNGKTTEIVSVHSSKLPCAIYREELAVTIRSHKNFARACNKDQAAVHVCT